MLVVYLALDDDLMRAHTHTHTHTHTAMWIA